jgi:transcriptional regulator with XRE-family HTH domain
MASAGVGVRALAKRSRVDKGTISAWHSGSQRRVRVATARKVAAALGAPVEYLLDLPPTGEEEEAGAALSSEQVRVLRRIAALAPAIEALEEPTTDLSQALAASGARLARLEDVLLQLKSLADDVRSAGAT